MTKLTKKGDKMNQRKKLQMDGIEKQRIEESKKKLLEQLESTRMDKSNLPQKNANIKTLKKIRRLSSFSLDYLVCKPKLSLKEWKRILIECLGVRPKGGRYFTDSLEAYYEKSRILLFINEAGAVIGVSVGLGPDICDIEYPFKYCLRILGKLLSNKRLRKMHKFSEKNIVEDRTIGGLFKNLYLSKSGIKKEVKRLVESCDEVGLCILTFGKNRVNLKRDFDSKPHKYKRNHMLEVRFKLDNLHTARKLYSELTKEITL
jgi:hypothetical protein